MLPGRLGKLCGWALQGYSAVAHCSDGWALQGCSKAGHCRDPLRLGLRILCLGDMQGISAVWALRGYLVVGHSVAACRHTRGWALREYVAIEHCSQAPGGGRGHHRLSNLTTPQRGWGIMPKQQPRAFECPIGQTLSNAEMRLNPKP